MGEPSGKCIIHLRSETRVPLPDRRRAPCGKCTPPSASVTTERRSSTSRLRSASTSVPWSLRLSSIRDCDMKRFAPYLANGCPRTCWNCGKPFMVRGGQAEAIVGDDNRLYCYREECEETALLSH